MEERDPFEPDPRIEAAIAQAKKDPNQLDIFQVIELAEADCVNVETPKSTRPIAQRVTKGGQLPATTISPLGRLDKQDADIIKTRMGKRVMLSGPQVGDYVRFMDGTEQRISYVWEKSFQVEANVGSYYLLKSGHLSMSGAHFPALDVRILKRVDQTREGEAWIFHHDQHTKDNGVYFLAQFRVWECERQPQR